MANEYEKLLRELHEERVKKNVKKEKEYYKELAGEYKKEKEKVNASLLSLFSKAEKDGVINSSELHKYNRINGVEETVAASLLSVNAIEKRAVKDRVKTQLEESIVNSSLLYSSFGNTKKFSVTDKELKAILEDPWAGEKYDETLTRRKKETAALIKREIVLAAAGTGAGVKDLTRIVDKRFNGALNNSLLVLQNELARADKEGERITSEKKDVKTKVKWVTALDDMTCDECGPLDGEIFENGDEPFIPVHPRCRCTVIHLIEGWDQTLRSARDVTTMKTYLTDAKTLEEYKKEQGIFKK